MRKLQQEKGARKCRGQRKLLFLCRGAREVFSSKRPKANKQSSQKELLGKSSAVSEKGQHPESQEEWEMRSEEGLGPMGRQEVSLLLC